MNFPEAAPSRCFHQQPYDDRSTVTGPTYLSIYVSIYIVFPHLLVVYSYIYLLLGWFFLDGSSKYYIFFIHCDRKHVKQSQGSRTLRLLETLQNQLFPCLTWTQHTQPFQLMLHQLLTAQWNKASEPASERATSYPRSALLHWQSAFTVAVYQANTHVPRIRPEGLNCEM